MMHLASPTLPSNLQSASAKCNKTLTTKTMVDRGTENCFSLHDEGFFPFGITPVLSSAPFYVLSVSAVKIHFSEKSTKYVSFWMLYCVGLDENL